MKIINLQAENIKRLIAVDITPNDNLVQITGKNGHGKTSVLDSIWWALEGAKNIQIVPINKGAVSARIKLDLGELIVTRTFKKSDNDKGFTTKLEVTNADGVKVLGGGQAILDGFLDAITFDPLEFERMKPKEQFDLLRKFVPGYDFNKSEEDNRNDYEARTVINREIKTEVALAGLVEFDDVLKKEFVEISDLGIEIEEASEYNSSIEIKKSNRNNYRIRIEELRKQAESLIKEADGIQEKLDAAGKLSKPIDITELNARLTKALISNKEIEEFEAKRTHAVTAKKLEKESEKITQRMDQRQASKIKAISDAKFPVRNVSLEDGIVLLDGVPFEQGSSAEKTRASLAIAMANNPKLRIIFIRDGSLLDSDSEKIIKAIECYI